MNGRLTTVLAGLVLLAGAWFWADGGFAPLFGKPQRPQPATGPRLLHIDARSVREVRIAASGRTVAFRRAGDSWEGAERPDMIDDFLENIGVLGIIFSESLEEAGLPDYGLAPPRYVVELHTGEGVRVLRVGDRNPSGTGVYVQLDTERAPVVLTGSLLLWEIGKLLRTAAAATPVPTPAVPAAAPGPLTPPGPAG